MDSEDEFFDAPEAFSLGSHVTEWKVSEDELLCSSFDFEHKTAQRRSRVESLKRSFVEYAASHPPLSGSLYSVNCYANRPISLQDPNSVYHGTNAFDSSYSKANTDTSSGAYPDESISRLWASLGSYQKTADHVDQDLGLFTRPSHAPTDGSADALQLNSQRSQPPSRARTFNAPSTHLHSSLDFARTSATIATFHPSDVSLGTAQRTFLPGLTEQESYYNSLADTLNSVCATSSAVQRFQGVSSAPEVSDSLKLRPDPNSSMAHAKSWSLDTARLHLTSGTSNDVWSRQIPSVPTVPEKLADFPDFPALPDPTLDRGCSPQPVSIHRPAQCTGVTCCLHRHSKVPDTGSREGNVSGILPVCSDIFSSRNARNAAVNTVPAFAKFDANDHEATLKVKLSDLPSRDRTLNATEFQYRSLTKSKSNKQELKDRLPEAELPRTGDGTTGKISKFQKYFRETVSAMKSAAKTKIFSQDEEDSDEDEEVIGNQGIRIRSSRHSRSRREFVRIKLVQEMKNEHTGAIWAMRFSPCGRLLATAGYDRNIRIWVLRQWYSYFKRLQMIPIGPDDKAKFAPSACGGEACTDSTNVKNTFDSVSITSNSLSASDKTDDSGSTCSSTQTGVSLWGGPNDYTHPCVRLVNEPDLERGRRTVFRAQPLLVYRGHEGVVTDVTWSKNLFILATSMDRQVRLWHISRRECLCLFQHNDTVPTIVFHPKDDRFFLSGSLDGKLRLWNIPDKKVRFWVEVPMPNALPVTSNATGSFTVSSLFKPASASILPTASPLGVTSRNLDPKTIITCAAFACDGTKVVVGTYDGRVMFYNSELTYITFIAIKMGSTRKGRHCRVTAIELDPTDSNKILVTSNDSRLRLIDARDYHTLCKYRGFVNETSQIRASFSPTGRYLISGSENAFFYIWQKSLEVERIPRFSRLRKDRSDCWEAIKAHDTMVTVALFSPNPNLVLDKQLRRLQMPFGRCLKEPGIQGVSTPLRLSELPPQADPRRKNAYLGEVIISADCNGCIRVFKNAAP
ncbi:unnamed protein product [Dicrocoelium dendriticum]|nr:unnamed protein product [Dicrocoelium dendriticum]